MRRIAARIGSMSIGASVALFAPAWISVALLAVARFVVLPFLFDWTFPWFWVFHTLDWPISPRWILVGVPGVAGAMGLVAAWNLHRHRFRLVSAFRPTVVRWTCRLTAMLSAAALAVAAVALILPGEEAYTSAAEGSAEAGYAFDIVRLASWGVPSARATIDRWLSHDDPSYRFLAAALVVSRDRRDDRARRILAYAAEEFRVRVEEPNGAGFEPEQHRRYHQGMRVLHAVGFETAYWPSLLSLIPLNPSAEAFLEWWDSVAPRLRPE